MAWGCHWSSLSCATTVDGYGRRAAGRFALNCEWCLDQKNHQGWYGECFVRVLGAAAALQVSPLEPDCTGTDFVFRATQEVDGDFPTAMVQVKTWSVPRSSGDLWRYSGLTQKRYNALAGRKRIPHYLFLVIVPPDVSRFALADPDALRLSHAAYWVSLEGKPRIAEPSCQRTVQVHVPVRNLLTVESLRALCELPPLGAELATGTEGTS